MMKYLVKDKPLDPIEYLINKLETPERYINSEAYYNNWSSLITEKVICTCISITFQYRRIYFSRGFIK